MASQGSHCGFGSVSLRNRGCFCAEVQEELDRFKADSSKLSVALGGRFEDSERPYSLSSLLSSGDTSWLVLNRLLSSGLRPTRKGAGVANSREVEEPLVLS